MLAGLDPHSSYMDSKSFREMQVQTRGARCSRNDHLAQRPSSSERLQKASLAEIF
jgi:C-terminal processing protease CtpA/Prc